MEKTAVFPGAKSLRRWDAAAGGMTVERFRLEAASFDERALNRAGLCLQTSPAMTLEVRQGPGYVAQRMYPGRFCILPAGTMPAVRWDEPRELIVVQLAATARAARSNVADTRMELLLRALGRELEEPAPDELFMDHLAGALAARLQVLERHAADGDGQRGGLAPAALRRVEEFVEAHLGRTVRMGELAAAAGLAEASFARAFRQATGQTPHAYVQARRVEAATALVRTTDKRLSEIALLTGFADQSHMTRTLKREHGAAPGGMRRAEGRAQTMPERFQNAEFRSRAR